MARRKTTIPSMMPVKEWLDKGEAMAYLTLNEKDFKELVLTNGLSQSSLTRGRKVWYKVSELKNLFDKYQFIKSTE